MKILERLLLWIPLLALLGTPLAWGADAGQPGASAAGTPAPGATPPAGTVAPGTKPPAGAPSPGAGGSGSPSAPGAASPALPSGPVDVTSARDHEAWVKRLREAYQAVDEARARQEKARVDYAKARHKRKTRGEAKRELLEERDASQDAVTEAQDRLAATLEEARRAGVPPGWLREARASAGPANGS